MNKIYGKIIIESNLELITGLHIGGGDGFAAIGAVDSVVVRNPVTMEPYIPGSSLKGKMRYLLARTISKTQLLVEPNGEDIEIKRLFGSSGKDDINTARLQFYDIFFNKDSKNRLEKMDTDLYLAEIKYENTINRGTAIANPRQNERVLPSSVFDFKLVYNVENLDEMEIDLKNIGLIMSLLEDDYLGGNGTRGYGRVKFKNSSYKIKSYNSEMTVSNDEIANYMNVKS